MAYNLTALGDNSTSILGFTQSVNNILMFGWLGAIFLIGLAAVIFTAFMWSTGGSVKRSVSGTAFLSCMLAILLAGMGLLSSFVLWITIALAAVSIAFTWNAA